MAEHYFVMHGVHCYWEVTGSERISFYTHAKSANHVAYVLRNGCVNMTQDTPIGKAVVRSQKEQKQMLKSLLIKQVRY